MSCRFSSGYDPNSVFVFDKDYCHCAPSEKSKSNKARLAVVEAVVLNDDSIAFENLWHIEKINAMLVDVRLAFGLIPLE